VQDSNVLLSPRILGTWTGSDPAYNPSEHKITLGAAPTASMREALREVGVNILGMKHNGGAIIGLVTDVQTGQTDGTFTPGGSLIIQGKKIKIAPAGESGLGIFLVNAAGEDIPLASPLTVNNPQQLIARTPLLPAGQYTLKIITRFAGSDLLNLPRTIIYAYPLRAETPVL
jgi:hypothetical protein